MRMLIFISSIQSLYLYSPTQKSKGVKSGCKGVKSGCTVKGIYG
jgi:hypothetical protein